MIQPAYVDPSPVMVVGGFLTVVLAFLGAAASALLLRFRRSLAWFVVARRRWLAVVALLLLASAGALAWYGWTNAPKGGPMRPASGRLVILGFDGMSAPVVEALMDEGLLPNFAALRGTGAYRRLATTTPPQSPVAWATFATGVGSGGHGVFDFIHRRDGSYLLDTVQTRFERGQAVSPLQAPAFWEFARETGTPMDVLFCPLTFPPAPINGILHAGMGTPDVLGTQGTYTVFTTRKPAAGEPAEEGQIVRIEDAAEQTIELLGPVFRGMLGKERRLVAKVGLRLDRTAGTATLRVGDETTEIAVGEWSPWLGVVFPMGPFRSIRGIVRFQLSDLASDATLYTTAVCHDPRAPWQPVSSPADYSKSLAQELGLYSTRGMPYDTWAFNDGHLTEAAFRQQAESLLRERRRICLRELPRCRQGVFFCYFDYSDVMQHMFWPGAGEGEAAQTPAIRACYQRMDEILGEVRRELEDQDTLLVLSDHGFTGFRRSLHLNSWLARRGLLVLRDGVTEGRELFADVDWSRTRAYACGFNGVFLNLVGREPQGCVEPGEGADALLAALAQGLVAWKDPETGKPVLPLVRLGTELYGTESGAHAPDLVVGPAAGYRVSWQTALGAAPAALIEPNTKRWSGTHLTDPAAVPGILFANRPLAVESPTLLDFAPTILTFAGLPADHPLWDTLAGHPLLPEAN